MPGAHLLIYYTRNLVCQAPEALGMPRSGMEEGWQLELIKTDKGESPRSNGDRREDSISPMRTSRAHAELLNLLLRQHRASGPVTRRQRAQPARSKIPARRAPDRPRP